MFESIVSKIILFLGFISIIISNIKGLSFKSIIIQCIVYINMANNANCIYGNRCVKYAGCKTRAWSIIIVPLLGIIIFALDYFNILINYIDYIDYIKNSYKKFKELS